MYYFSIFCWHNISRFDNAVIVFQSIEMCSLRKTFRILVESIDETILSFNFNLSSYFASLRIKII